MERKKKNKGKRKKIQPLLQCCCLPSQVCVPGQVTTPGWFSVTVKSVPMKPNSQHLEEYDIVRMTFRLQGIFQILSTFTLTWIFIEKWEINHNGSYSFCFRKWISATPVLMVYSFSELMKRQSSSSSELRHNASFVISIFMHFTRRTRSPQVSGVSLFSFLLGTALSIKQTLCIIELNRISISALTWANKGYIVLRRIH